MILFWLKIDIINRRTCSDYMSLCFMSQWIYVEGQTDGGLLLYWVLVCLAPDIFAPAFMCIFCFFQVRNETLKFSSG